MERLHTQDSRWMTKQHRNSKEIDQKKRVEAPPGNCRPKTTIDKRHFAGDTSFGRSWPQANFPKGEFSSKHTPQRPPARTTDNFLGGYEDVGDTYKQMGRRAE